MKKYYFNDNADSNGFHEIHTEDCYFLPFVSNRVYLGTYSSSSAAMIAARLYYPTKKFDGCYYCCREIHKG